MASTNQVIAGEYVDTRLSINSKSELVLTWGFKGRKVIDSESVAEWDVVSAEGNLRAGLANSARFLGNVGATAVDSVVSGQLIPSFGGRKGKLTTVRIEWADGKQSLIKMKKELFVHLELILNNRKAVPSAPPAPDEPPPTAVTPAAVQPDVIEQIAQLAVLRDQGVLSEDEFETKKAELLARL